MTHISDLLIYPVKSSKAIRLESSQVVSTGLLHDRMFAVINGSQQVITGREQPLLLRISSEINGSELRLKAPGMDTLRLPLFPEAGKPTEIELFKKPLNGMLFQNGANEWISEFLGQSCRLMFVHDTITRPVTKKDDPEVRGKVGYADSSPILLISEASLQELNSRLKTPVSMDRFRPNIVVEGCEPFEEDRWDKILINDCELVVNKRCKRCIFTTIDPETLQKDQNQEPLRTLSGYRTQDGGVPFGIYLIPATFGRIKIGDEIRIN